MDDDTETLRGNLHAMEFLLGQLFVNQVAKYDDPQGWLLVNVRHTSELLDRRKAEGKMSEASAEAARGTIRRVMQTAATSLETAGAGPSQV